MILLNLLLCSRYGPEAAVQLYTSMPGITGICRRMGMDDEGCMYGWGISDDERGHAWGLCGEDTSRFWAGLVLWVALW